MSSEYMLLLNYYEKVGLGYKSIPVAYGGKDRVITCHEEFKKIEHHWPVLKKAIREGTYHQTLNSLREDIVKTCPGNLYQILDQMRLYYHEHPIAFDANSTRECAHEINHKSGYWPKVSSTNGDLKLIYECKQCDFGVCKSCVKVGYVQQQYIVVCKIGTIFV